MATRAGWIVGASRVDWPMGKSSDGVSKLQGKSWKVWVDDVTNGEQRDFDIIVFCGVPPTVVSFGQRYVSWPRQASFYGAACSSVVPAHRSQSPLP